MPANRIAADTAHLFDIASKVNQLGDHLAQATAHFDDGWYASRDIESALNDFVRAWSDRRAELIELLRGSHAILSAAADGFQELDSSMASALDGSTVTEAS